MNPSYTNGVGSQVPQNNPQISGQPVQQPAASQPMMAAQQPVMTPQQPIMTPQQPIASGTGDVVLSGGGAEKKSRKGVVVLVVLIVLLALVGGGFLLWQNGVFGGGSNSSSSNQQSNNLQSAYNSYVNYVLWGVESDGKPDLTAMEQARPYFMSLQGNNNSTAIDTYLVKTEEKYSALKSAYDATNVENKVDITVLKAYFEDLVRMNKLTQDEMLAVYLTDGEQEVRALINNTYSIKNESINELSAAKKELSETLLSVTMKTVAAGCVQDKKIKSGCYQLTDEEKQSLTEEAARMVDSEDSLMSKARGAMYNLYNELYGNTETINGGNA